jgi:hypothetical protein
MRHVILTCKNHPNLRWSCKEIAFSDEYGYNGTRHIFFNGEPNGEGMYSDGSGLNCSSYFPERENPVVKECSCQVKDLIRAPEDKDVRRYGEPSEEQKSPEPKQPERRLC